MNLFNACGTVTELEDIQVKKGFMVKFLLNGTRMSFYSQRKILLKSGERIAVTGRLGSYNGWNNFSVSNYCIYEGNIPSFFLFSGKIMEIEEGKDFPKFRLTIFGLAGKEDSIWLDASETLPKIGSQMTVAGSFESKESKSGKSYTRFTWFKDKSKSTYVEVPEVSEPEGDDLPF